MLFSVIVPVYNVEPYLRECVDSILNQNFSDYEIILVNDGSTDNSGKICDDYANRYENVIVIHQKNSGQAFARNKGLEASTGDYIVFLDSDDFIAKDNFFTKLKEKAVLCPDLIFYKFSKFIEGTWQPVSFSYQEAIRQKSYVSRLVTMVNTDAFYGMAWIKAIRRELLILKKIYFDVNLVCEDMDWNYKLILNAETIELIDESYIAYRQREMSVTKTLTLKTLNDYIFTLEKWSLEASKNLNLKQVVYKSLAKYYSNLLVVYIRVRDINKKQFLLQISQLSTLLKYATGKRAIMIKYAYKLFGLSNTLRLLSIFDKIK